MNFITLLLVFIFCSIACIHIYWALGGNWAMDAVVPTTEDGKNLFTPRWPETLAVAFILFGLALLILLKVKWLTFYSLPNWMERYGLLVLALLFLIRAIGEFNYVGFFKRKKHSRFAYLDTCFYAPLCLGIAVLCLVLQGLAA